MGLSSKKSAQGGRRWLVGGPCQVRFGRLRHIGTSKRLWRYISGGFSIVSQAMRSASRKQSCGTGISRVGKERRLWRSTKGKLPSSQSRPRGESRNGGLGEITPNRLHMDKPSVVSILRAGARRRRTEKRPWLVLSSQLVRDRS